MSDNGPDLLSVGPFEIVRNIHFLAMSIFLAITISNFFSPVLNSATPKTYIRLEIRAVGAIFRKTESASIDPLGNPYSGVWHVLFLAFLGSAKLFVPIFKLAVCQHPHT